MVKVRVRVRVRARIRVGIRVRVRPVKMGLRHSKLSRSRVWRDISA